MPFVRLDALRADAARLEALGRAVHEALIDAMGIPEDDLFQVLSSHDGESGTSAMTRTISASIVTTASCTRNLFLALHENELVDWSFGEGVAQYVTGSVS